MSLISLVRTTLLGHHLLAARLGWTAILLLTFGMLSANLPHVYGDTLDQWVVREAAPAALRLFSNWDAYIYTLIVLRLITLSTFILTALFLAWRKWADWFSLYISATLLLLGYFFGSYYDVALIRYPAVLEQFFPAIRAVAPSLTLISMLLIFYLFPDGRFTPRRLAWFTIPAVIFTLMVFFEAFFKFQGLLPESAAEDGWGWELFVFSIFLTAAVGLAGQIYRYRRVSNTEQRQQTKWVLLGLASVILSPWLAMVTFFLFPSVGYVMRQFISLFAGSIIPILLPLTIAFSILRYRLWEVDIWINRAVVYGGLTAVILLLYGLGIGLFSSLVPGNTTLLIPFIALTAAVLIAFPAHRRLQGLADKWLPRPRTGEPPLRPGQAPRSLCWRLAHLLWLAFFTFLNWQLLRIFSSYPSIHATMQADWGVQMSVEALPGVSLAGYAAYMILFRMATAVLYWLAAVLIFWRKRDDWFALAISFLLLFLPFGLALGEITTGPLAVLGQFSLLGMLLVPFFFPDGRLVPRTRRWRIALAAFLLLFPVLTFTLLPALVPVNNQEDIEWASLIISINAILLAGLASMFVRYRQMTAGERRQIRWVLTIGFGSLSVLFLFTIFWSLGYLERGGVSEPVSVLIALHLNNLSASAFPLAIGYSILRHRLWGVEVLVNRTLVFGGLTLLVAAVYILTVGLLSSLFQSGGSILFSVLATGLIAILFNPLRQRLQTAVNRLMYGERDNPITLLTALGKRLEETAVPAEILPALVETIAQSLKLPYVAVTVGEGILAASGQPPPRQTRLALPLIYQSETIGQLLLSTRSPGEAFSPAEMNLLKNVARQAGTAVFAAQLTADLQHSRERLVTTREEERRRIRRDLHDGLGPQLATLSLKVDAARNYLEHNPQAADSLLSELKGEIQNAISDIRRLVHDLRPPALDQLGLVSALRQFAGSQDDPGQNSPKQLDVSIHTPEELPPLPAAVEVAAYRIALEALTNARRHSQARRCQICLKINGGLYLEIEDDGLGLPVGFQAGVGLSSMRERTAELGGTFRIETAENGGTRITVRLPI